MPWKLTASIFLCLTLSLIGCSSSSRNPGFSIHSTPVDYKVDVSRVCDRKYTEWEHLANIPIRPFLGTSKIKQILSAIHNLGLTYWEGCPEAGIVKDFKKGFIYLQLANEFEYIPTRYVLGEALLEGTRIEKNSVLGTSYLQQVIFCDKSFGGQYRRNAEDVLAAANRPFSSDTSEFDQNCNQIPGAYFKGPTVDFDALAFKLDWESRSETISESWGWLGAGFRGTTTIIREAIPVALAGAAAYYSAKSTQQFQSVPEYSRSSVNFSNSSSAFQTGAAETSYIDPFPVQGSGGSQIFTSSLECTSDLQCGVGKVCVKPHDGVALTGLCGSLVDQYGIPTFTVPTPSATPHDVSSCTFDTDCPIGFKCRKAAFEVTGVCMQ